MNVDALHFSKLRLSPVQVASYGHSSSTHGSEVDYFVGMEYGTTSDLETTLGIVLCFAPAAVRRAVL